MPFLRTIITYNQPSEAEVDKTYLESHSIPVCLLNGNTSRNELGAPFYIQLQVNDEDYARARDLLREANPQRFGSPDRVSDIDRQVKRTALGFVVFALFGGGIAFITLSPSAQGDGTPLGEFRSFDARVQRTIVATVVAGCAGAYWFGRKSK